MSSRNSGFFEARPWLKTIGHDERWLRNIAQRTTLDLFDASVRCFGNRTAIEYFGYTISWERLAAQSDAFAAYLVDNGFRHGDRLAMYLQNVPHFYIALFGAWKAGGAVVPLNPMYKDELLHLLADSGAVGIVVSDEGFNERVEGYVSDLPIVVTCNSKDFAPAAGNKAFANLADQPETGRPDLLTVLNEYDGRSVAPRCVGPEDLAMIGYTSGTSGKAKGAALSHGNLTVNAQRLKVIEDYDERDAVYTLAPVFHITGLLSLLSATATGASVVMNYRFEPETALETLTRTRPAYMAGPATAYVALISHPKFSSDAFSSFKSLVSGGAPLPGPLVDKFEQVTGHYVVQGYGLTETTGPCVFVPQNMRAPVDPESGNLSCGIPLANASFRIVDADGVNVGPREVGEILVSGPMTVAEYHRDPESTAAGIPDGEVRTGDMAFMDEGGWVYIVDRKKDMINASGFKVWPREIEDILYRHPDVREVAVVGVPDEYRGESVVAFVTVEPNGSITENGLIEFCRDRLASYKSPRSIRFVSELPKTASGKILRREVRSRSLAEAAPSIPVVKPHSAEPEKS